MEKPTLSPSLCTVLVTGGCGFIGSHIVEALLDDPSAFRIAALSRNPTNFRYPNVSYHSVSITDKLALSKLLHEVQPKVIIHTISPGHAANFKTSKKVNLEGTRILLDLAKEQNSVKAFVYTSSQSAVEISHTVRTEATAHVNALDANDTPYARTKGATDTLVRDFNGPDLKTCTLRICSLYGERDKTTILPMLNTLKAGQTNIQVGNDKPEFDWVYAPSAAIAHVLAARALVAEMECLKNPNEEERVAGMAFFITDDSPMPLWKFTRRVWEAAGGKIPPKEKVWRLPLGLALMGITVVEWVYWIVSFGSKAPNVRRADFEFMKGGYRFDIDEAKKRLGYQPVCDTEEGIRRTVKWFQENEDWEQIDKKNL